jgi:hypothetical protein
LYFKVVATDNSCGFTGESTTATYAAPVAPIVAASMFADCDQVTVNYSANAANAVMISLLALKEETSPMVPTEERPSKSTAPTPTQASAASTTTQAPAKLVSSISENHSI